jgi:hypothetical protein
MSDDTPAPPEHHENPIPGVARLAATAAWNTSRWTLGTSVRATRRVIGVAMQPSTAPELIEDVRETMQAAAREIVGMADLEERVRTATAPPSGAARKVAESVPGADRALRVVESVPAVGVARKVAEAVTAPPSGETLPAPAAPTQLPARRQRAAEEEHTLRARGQALLYKSRDVHYEEDAHPAFVRLLDSLAPDEARILRLMLLKGPQPAVDVRTGGPLGLVTSRLLAPGLSMIGPRAGLKYVDRVPSYLTNLNRLGLIWFSRETLRDPERYQVLEAQPEVLEAVHSVRAAKIIRRSIQLTPFGDGFCRASLVTDAERHGDLPEHASPGKRRVPQPPAVSG